MSGVEVTVAALVAGAAAGGSCAAKAGVLDMYIGLQDLAAADQAGVQTGKHVVDLGEAKCVQVGDHNVQHNTFS
jgi:hypothetical protein